MTKKIHKVQIHNFQSHADLTLLIAPMLTTIVGASDAGKSAVIRALRWALFNEPAGTQYMRVGTKDTYVLVEFTDGTSLLRARDRTENYYVLKGTEGDPVRLEGFGQGVPKEVEDFTGIRKIQIGEKDSLAVNIAGQLEGPFLLGEKSSVRAEAIGRLAGTDRIDAALRTANADKFTNQRRIGQLTLDAQKLEEQLDSFSYLPELAKRIQTIESLTKRIRSVQLRLEPLQRLQQRARINGESLASTRKRAASYTGLQQAQFRYADAVRALERKQRLAQWQSRNRTNQAAYHAVKDELAHRSRFLDFVQTHRLTHRAERWAALSDLQKRYRRWKASDALTRVKAQWPLQEATNLQRHLIETGEHLQRLREIQTQFSDRQSRLQTGVVYLQRLENLPAAQQAMNQGLTAVERRNCLRNLRQRLHTCEANVQQTKERLLRIEKELQEQLDAYIDRLDAARQCPYCLQDLDADRLAHLRTHLERDTNHEL